MSYGRLSGLAALLCLAAAPAFCDPVLQDWEFNINGVDYYPSGGATLGTVPGLNSASFNATTGEGTLTLTYNPGVACTDCFIGFWVWDPVSVPFYNEYGSTSGSPASGESWQIDNPEYDVNPSGNLAAGSNSILDNLASGTLDDTNWVTGTTGNYLSNCGALGGGAPSASCDNAVSMALGFTFNLSAGQEEVITVNTSTTNTLLGGFSVEDIHPVDGKNTTQSQLFLSANAVTQPVSRPPTVVPEPSSWLLLATAGGFLALHLRKRLAER